MKPLLQSCLLILVSGFICIQAQVDRKPETTDTTQKTNEIPADERGTVTIILVGSGPLVVDEVSESSDGYWYKRGTITTFLDRERVARIEFPKAAEEPTANESATRTGKWRLADTAKVKDFFLEKFNRPLPVSAFGQSDLHTRWGLDHRNGMDVGLHPDSTEGRALINFLRAESIPFLVFRGPIPGVATGPHIHIGNRSSRSYGR